MGIVDGQVVIVTGAARAGLGRDNARYFAQDGSDVVLADINETAAAAGEASGAGPRCIGVDTACGRGEARAV